MSQKHQRSEYRENTYVSLMIENVTRIKSGIAINIGVSAKIQKSIIHLKNIWNPATCSCKNDEYIRSVITQIIMMKNCNNQI